MRRWTLGDFVPALIIRPSQRHKESIVQENATAKKDQMAAGSSTPTSTRTGGHPDWPRQETRVATTVGLLPYKEALEWDHK
jgi:hypothetical protein